MSRFMLYIAGWVMFIGLASVLMNIIRPVDSSYDEVDFDTVLLEQENPALQEILQAYRSNDYLKALKLAEKYEPDISGSSATESSLKQQFYYLMTHTTL